MRNIKYIVIHCSAGFGTLESVKKFWKSKGWQNVGYHFYIDSDGTVHKLANLTQITNGVLGYNTNSVHISYQGGVDKNNVSKAMDTRTVAQKQAIEKVITTILTELKETFKMDLSKIKILGHRDFSPDKNGSGVIESWERIKECPSFDAIPEYRNNISNFLKSF